MPCLISTGGHLLEFRNFPTRFGTSPDNEIVIQEGLGIMPHHFTLRREGARIVLESSGQGATTVNGNDVRRANIQDGDRLQVGQLMLVYSNPSAQEAPFMGGQQPEKKGSVMPVQAPEVVAGTPFDLVPIPGLADSSNSGPPQSDRNQVVSDAMSGFSEMAVSPYGGAVSAAQHPSAQKAPDSAVPAPVAANQLPGENPFSAPDVPDPFSTVATQQEPSVPVDNLSAGAMAVAGEDSAAAPLENPLAALPAISNIEVNALPKENLSVSEHSESGMLANDSPPLTESPRVAFDEETVTEVSVASLPMDNPFVGAVAIAPEALPSLEDGFETVAAPKSALTENPSELVVESDPAREAVFETAIEPDLAEVFFGSDGDLPKITSIPAEPVEVPPIPEIFEAEKSGATVEANQLSSKDINPIGFLINRKRPVPPMRTTPVSAVTPQPAETIDPMNEERSKKPKKSKRSRRRKKATPGVAGRMERSKQEPKYRTQIPWHKVAIFCCLIFAVAGAYVANQGQSFVDEYLGVIGFKSDPEHHSYLPRLASANPTFMVTMDADRFVRFYRKWAVENEEWMTVAELENMLKEFAGRIQLANLDQVTLAMDAQGEILTLVSMKSDLNRQVVMRDLGKGILVSERVGDVAVHEGLVGKRHAVKFALLNAKTMVVGDPAITMNFIKATASADPMTGLDYPAQTLAETTNDLLGCYYTKESLVQLKERVSLTLRPTVERLLSLVQSQDASEERVLARIGMDMKVEGDFTFGSESEARAFAAQWKGKSEERLQMLLSLLGQQASVLKDSEKDLGQTEVTALGKRARLNLSVPNRWASLSVDSARETLGYLVDAFHKRPVETAPSLLTREEREARKIARRVEHEYAQSMGAGTKVFTGVRDIEAIVKKMEAGVRGEGAYHKVVYKVPKMEGYLTRVVELLRWKEDELVMTIREAGAPRESVVTGGDKEEDL